MVIAVIYFCFPYMLGRIPDYEEGAFLQLSGQVYKYENKSGKLYVYLKNASAEREGREEKYNKALLILEDSEKNNEIRLGNTVSALCRYVPMSRARNKGNYDEEKYYRSLGIYLKTKADQVIITDPWIDAVSQFFYDIGADIRKSIYESVEDEEIAGVLSAICTGDRTGLTSETRKMYQRSGIAHILAVSGLHISTLGMALFRLIRKRVAFSLSFILSALVMTGFCIMSSGSASAFRATIMFLVQILGIGLGKKVDMLCSVSLAGIILLLAEPYYIANSGFWLSFAAVLAVALPARALNSFLKPKSSFVSGLITSVCITLVTLPVTAMIYYEIPLYSVLFNIVIIPLMSMVLGMGLLSGITGLFSLLAGRFFCGLGVYIVKFIYFMCSLTDSLPFARIVTGYVDEWRIIVYYSLLTLISSVLMTFAHREKEKKEVKVRTEEKGRNRLCRRKYRMVLCMAAVLMFLLFFKIRDNKLHIYFLDVGQGDCIVLSAPSGRVYMIDGGSSNVSKTAEYRISGAVKYLGISHIDLCIASHPDTDHISGIVEIISEGKDLGLSIGKVMSPALPDNEKYRSLANLCEEMNVDFADIHEGMKITDGDLTFACLHPADDYVSEGANGYSAVLDMRYGDFTALFTGDLELDGESILLTRKGYEMPQQGYSLLKLAHHGSKNSSSQEFLDRVKAQLVVISAGVGNVYGHPNEETLARIKKAGSSQVCTKDYGEIEIIADKSGKMTLSLFTG